jgi:tetratricopeptide (TPR) repeat protein
MPDAALRTEDTLEPLPPLEPRTRSVPVVAIVAAALAVLVYANSLGNGLVYDDVVVVATNEAARDPLALGTIFGTPSWFAAGSPTIAYRPFTTWTFALDFAVHGLHPFGYHLVNVVLHGAVSALVVLVGVAFGLALPVAGLAGALFAVHPVHTEVVANVVGRAELLAAAFALLALLGVRRTAAGPGGILGALGVVAAYGLAVLSKEHAIALVVILPLAQLLADRSGRAVGRRLGAARLVLYAGLVAVTVGYLVLRTRALGGVVGAEHAVQFWMNPAASAPAELRVMTALHVLALACWRLVMPFRLAADYSFREIPVAASVMDPGVIAGGVVAVALAGLAVALWRRSRPGLIWLALALLSWGIVSNLVLPIGTIFGERLLYLPSVGFCLLAAMALVRPVHEPRPALVAVAALALVAWGVRTVVRNAVWRTDLAFAEQLVRDAPESAHAHHVLGTTYSQLGRDDEALREFDRALRILPEDVASLYNAGVIYQRGNKLAEALAVFSRVTAIDPGYFPAWINRASAGNQLQQFDQALDAADHAIAVRADVPNAHVVRGFALRGLERHADARAAFEEALRLAPTMPEALLGLGANAVDEHDFALAASAFERLVAVAPVSDAWRGLVYSYRQLGRMADADRAAASARERFPNDPFFAPD